MKPAVGAASNPENRLRLALRDPASNASQIRSILTSGADDGVILPVVVNAVITATTSDFEELVAIMAPALSPARLRRFERGKGEVIQKRYKAARRAYVRTADLAAHGERAKAKKTRAGSQERNYPP